MRLGRRFILIAAATIGFALATAPAWAIDAGAASAFVSRAVDDAVATFSGKTVPRQEKTRLAEALVGRYSDLRVISSAILGRYWGAATAEQQAKFPSLLIEYALSAWAPMGDLGGAGSKLRVISTQPAGDSLIVHSFIGPPGEQPVPLDWTVTTGAGGRLVIADASVDHVSFIRTMHDDFASFLRSNGGSVDALMAAMQKKIDSNAAATK